MTAVSTKGKAVIGSLLDKSLFAKHVGFVTLSPLMCLQKLEQTSFDGALQQFSAFTLHP